MSALLLLLATLAVAPFVAVGVTVLVAPSSLTRKLLHIGVRRLPPDRAEASADWIANTEGELCDPDCRRRWLLTQVTGFTSVAVMADARRALARVWANGLSPSRWQHDRIARKAREQMEAIKARHAEIEARNFEIERQEHVLRYSYSHAQRIIGRSSK